jgi:hypothetical protein
MSATELEAIFEGLDQPPLGGTGLRYSIASVPGTRFARVGKSADDAPALLLSVSRDGPAPQEIRLKNLVVLFSAPCRVTGTNGTSDATFAVVAYEGEPSLRAYFFEAATTFVAALGDQPTATEVDQVLRGFVELFRAVNSAPRRTTQGLWGELLLMADSPNTQRLFRSWHDEPGDRYDFAEDDVRVEVKTCGRSRRQHHFSLEQLTGEPLDVYVASLMVEPSAAGVSIAGLLAEVGTKLGSAADVATLFGKVGAVLGASWRDYAGARFDRALAISSIKVFRATDVPRVPTPLPDEVSRVSFASDLAACPAFDHRIGQQSGSLVACLP